MKIDLSRIFSVAILTFATSTAALSQPVAAELKNSPKPAPKQPVVKILKGGYWQFGEGDYAFHCHEFVAKLPSGSQPGIECLKNFKASDFPGTRLLTEKPYLPEGEKVWSNGHQKLVLY